MIFSAEFLLIPKRVCACGQVQRKNLQCRMIDVGVWGWSTAGKEVWGQSPQRLANFTIF